MGVCPGLMQLTPVERDILSHLLLNGDDMAANIAEEYDRHRGSVTRSFSSLSEMELVRNKGNGVYELTNAGVRVAQNIT